jgi:hypothetical protein
MELEKNVINASGISVQTKMNYANHFKILKSMFMGKNKDLETIILNPKKTIDKIYKKYPAITSRRAVLSSILGIFKYNPIFKQQYPNIYDFYLEEVKGLSELIQQKYDNNDLSERQKEQFFTWDELLQAVDKMEKGTQEHLLMRFYTLLPPVRLDLNEVRIFKREPKLIDKDKYNYIVLRARGTLVLVLSQYKTANTYGKQEIVLPKQLAKELRVFISNNPDRQYLFLNRNNELYTEPTMSLYITNILKKILGKHSSMNMIRHAYVNYINNDKNMTTGEKKQVAKGMGHSLLQQENYRLMPNENIIMKFD